jgi:hypothetical protein
MGTADRSTEVRSTEDLPTRLKISIHKNPSATTTPKENLLSGRKLLDRGMTSFLNKESLRLHSTQAIELI